MLWYNSARKKLENPERECGSAVYKSPPGQSKLEFAAIPFEFIPDPNNRWVILAKIIPWDRLELASGYYNHFGSTGNPALHFRVAMGALIIQARMKLSDEETVEQIKENPYLQHFLGFEGYRSEKKPFDPSMMVHFRKRLGVEALQAVDRLIYERGLELEAAAEEARRKAEEESEAKNSPADGSADTSDDDASKGSSARGSAGGAKKSEGRAKKGRRAKAKKRRGGKKKTEQPKPEARTKKRTKTAGSAKKNDAPADASTAPVLSSGTSPDTADEPAAVSIPAVAEEDALPEPGGTLILDATCAEADITYPTDLKLLIGSRENLERIIEDRKSVV